MTSELAARLIDVFGALLLFTTLLILAAGQLFRAIYAVAAQAVFLGLAGAVLAAATGNADLWVIAGITIVVKAILSRPSSPSTSPWRWPPASSCSASTSPRSWGRCGRR